MPFVIENYYDARLRVRTSVIRVESAARFLNRKKHFGFFFSPLFFGCSDTDKRVSRAGVRTCRARIVISSSRRSFIFEISLDYY